MRAAVLAVLVLAAGTPAAAQTCGGCVLSEQYIIPGEKGSTWQIDTGFDTRAECRQSANKRAAALTATGTWTKLFQDHAAEDTNSRASVAFRCLPAGFDPRR